MEDIKTEVEHFTKAHSKTPRHSSIKTEHVKRGSSVKYEMKDIEAKPAPQSQVWFNLDNMNEKTF